MNSYFKYYDKENAGVFEILHEKLNIFNSSEVVNQFRSLIEQGSGKAVIIDLKNVTHIDSVGIGFLIAIKNICAKKGCEVSLVCTSEVVLKVLTITKMDSFFRIYPALDDAMRAVSDGK